jgi:cobyrinic acid a,c-diamide synthase
VKGLLVAGTASGVGKTTVALTIMAALRRRGYAVQPFKCGPDFLDTGHHTRISGRTARNLDTWMLNEEANRQVVRSAAKDADVIVAEGMMGLFDGKSSDGDLGSSAEIARLLQLPVVLVVDAAKSARSLAAVVMGFERFDPQLKLAGVILNRVAGERHYEMIREAITSTCRTKVMGWLPRDAEIAIAERHLGLHSAVEQHVASQDSMIDRLSALAEGHLYLEELLALQCGIEKAGGESSRNPFASNKQRLRMGVAYDRAFSFYYEDNFDLLHEHGVDIVRFSPLNDDSLPCDVDALYLGGGYPELYAAELSGNHSMLREIRDFAASGKPVYAECGGMMYLAQALNTADGIAYPMAGVLPVSFQMADKLVRFGYATVEFVADCLLGPAGTVVRGHSFHYSRATASPALETSYRVHYSLSGEVELEGFRHGNVLASYIHLHFRANPVMAESFVAAIRQVRSLRAVTI